MAIIVVNFLNWAHACFATVWWRRQGSYFDRMSSLTSSSRLQWMAWEPSTVGVLLRDGAFQTGPEQTRPHADSIEPDCSHKIKNVIRNTRFYFQFWTKITSKAQIYPPFWFTAGDTCPQYENRLKTSKNVGRTKVKSSIGLDSTESYFMGWTISGWDGHCCEHRHRWDASWVNPDSGKLKKVSALNSNINFAQFHQIFKKKKQEINK